MNAFVQCNENTECERQKKQFILDGIKKNLDHVQTAFNSDYEAKMQELAKSIRMNENDDNIKVEITYKKDHLEKQIL